MRLLDDATIVWDKWHAIEEEIVLAVVSVAVFFCTGVRMRGTSHFGKRSPKAKPFAGAP